MAIYRLKRFGSSAAEDHREKRKVMDPRSIARDASLGAVTGGLVGALTASPDSDTFVNKDQISKSAAKTAIAGAVGVTALGMGRRAISNALRREDEPEQKEYTFRGYGRGALIGGIGGALATRTGGQAGLKAREEGLSDEEATRIAAKRGALHGALGQGGYQLVRSVTDPSSTSYVAGKLYKNLFEGTEPNITTKDKIIGTAIDTSMMAGLGALGGYLGAKKNYRVNRDEASESTRKGWDKAKSEKVEREDEPKQKEYAFRGYGRGLLLGGIGGVVGTRAGGNKGIEAREEGASDVEAKRIAAKHGAKMGAMVQGGLGAVNSIGSRMITNKALKNPYVNELGFGPDNKSLAKHALGVVGDTALNAAYGALGGYLGADKNYRVNRDEASESTRKGWDKKRSEKDE